MILNLVLALTAGLASYVVIKHGLEWQERSAQATLERQAALIRARALHHSPRPFGRCTPAPPEHQHTPEPVKLKLTGEVVGWICSDPTCMADCEAPETGWSDYYQALIDQAPETRATLEELADQAEEVRKIEEDLDYVRLLHSLPRAQQRHIEQMPLPRRIAYLKQIRNIEEGADVPPLILGSGDYNLCTICGDPLGRDSLVTAHHWGRGIDHLDCRTKVNKQKKPDDPWMWLS